MSKTPKRILIAIPVALAISFTGVYIAGRSLRGRLEPMVKEQAIRYLHDRFDADVRLASLKIELPRLSALGLVFHKQLGAIVQVDAGGLNMSRPGTHEPLFAIEKLHFTVDVASILEARKAVDFVSLQGVRITVPPKREQPASSNAGGETESKKVKPLNVEVEQIDLRDAVLVILPKDTTRNPLEYHIDHAIFTPVGPDQPLNYSADLNIPKPPGHVISKGRFGPWNADEPGDTKLDGDYTFEHADLGIFNGIAGMLASTGKFEGTLDDINVKGEASVPDFRLKTAGNPLPLKTQFEVRVDGTNGNTILQPVHATLGSTRFTTTGAIIKHDNDPKRSINLQVDMPDGNLQDLLRLAMKGSPFMEGRIHMKTSIGIPPLIGRVKQKLTLDGNFNLRDAKFLKSTIQSQIDGLSRHGQGDPNNEGIDEVASNMKGSFRLENQVMTFRSLSFDVPGAGIALAGTYNLRDQGLDFKGSLALDAKVSQMVTGWKSVLLRPIDPLFAKNGAGTFLHILVEGTARAPRFGVQFGKHEFTVGTKH